MDNSSAYSALIVCTLAMITVPIASFFAGKHIYEQTFAGDGSIPGAVCAVITANLIVSIFVYKAYQEDKKYAEKAAEKRD